METLNPLDQLFADAKMHGIPMARLCEEAGIDPTTPSRWKRGLTKPSFEKLMGLREALTEIVAKAA